MATINASASLPVRRIIDGDTLSLYFNTSGVPLFQGVNPNTKVVTPNWTNEEGKYPIITPRVGSARKQGVELVNHKWKYNGAEITFGNNVGGWCISTNFNSRFKLKTSDGSLGIIGNLASADNQDADVITYEGVANIGSATYPMSRSIDVLISPLGGSAYYGGISATSTMLGITDPTGAEITSCNLTFWLFNSAGTVETSFKVRLLRGDVAATDKVSGTGKITVHRDKQNDDDKLYVDSHQLFIAEFYVDGVNDAVYRAGISIDDAADNYDLTLYADKDGVSSSQNVTVRAKLIDNKTRQVVAPARGTVTFYILKNSDMTEVRNKEVTFASASEFNTANIVVTNTDAADGDILVNAEVMCEI